MCFDRCRILRLSKPSVRRLSHEIFLCLFRLYVWFCAKLAFTGFKFCANFSVLYCNYLLFSCAVIVKSEQIGDHYYRMLLLINYMSYWLCVQDSGYFSISFSTVRGVHIVNDQIHTTDRQAEPQWKSAFSCKLP
jgi:hypothetical protein